jgi:hypothetical protein
LRELRDAVDALSPAARSELSTVVRIGQSDLAADDWDGLLAEAVVLGDQTISCVLFEDADLHDHIVKGFSSLK